MADYLIDQHGKSWSTMLSGWSPPLPPSFTVWLVNRFGDVFAVFEDGSVNFLDVGQGTLSRVADDREDFTNKLDVGDNSDEWLLASCTDECVKAGLTLSENQCYSYKTPPILGGS